MESRKVVLSNIVRYTISMTIITIKNKYQIVIPAKVRKEAGLRVGDFLEARIGKKKEIILTAQTVVDREKWAHLPKGIREGLEDVRAGRVKGPFYSVSELRKDLEL